MNENLAIYRCMRSTALWFAGLNDGYDVTVRDGQTFKFDVGETKCHAVRWYTRSLPYWAKSQVSALDVLASRCSLNDGDATFAPNAALRAGTECVCPKCTLKRLEEILSQKAQAKGAQEGSCVPQLALEAA